MLYVLSFLLGLLYSHSSVFHRSFIATYQKEQSFSFSKHKLKSSGTILFNKKEVLLSEQARRKITFMYLQKDKAILLTKVRDKISRRKFKIRRPNSILLQILKTKSANFVIRRQGFIDYYFSNRNVRYAVISTEQSTGALRMLEYEDNQGSVIKVRFLWFKFI